MIPSTNTDFAILTDSEISSILSYFSEDMTFDIIDNALSNTYRPYAPTLANIVEAYEQNFKINMERYQGLSAELKDKRDDLYNAIIKKVLNHYGLQYVEQPNIDTYTMAYYVYKFLVSEFSANVLYFFVAYIDKEKTSIANIINMDELRKNKDSSSVYSKKVITGPGSSKMQVIHANLDLVLDAMGGFDVTIYDIINTLYSYGGINTLLTNSIVDTGDFFKTFYMNYINTYKAESITKIRLGLQPVPTDGGISMYTKNE